MGGDLQQCNLVSRTFPEYGARLGVETEDVVPQQVIYSPLRLPRRKNGDYPAWEYLPRQVSYLAFVKPAV